MDTKNKFSVTSKTLKLEFDSPKAAEHFKSWLCDSGEQEYWAWMEYREQEEDGPITGLEFDYWTGGTIKVTCGRLDGEE